ncbi:glycosyltransferase family 39 protein [Marinilongibacter aquaticus]|uniref:ArnT family glycosyltransferase n=1 Tax=Marinilongibacter aquaticus TaxID=2975157 RepID=UPI0021BD16F1|nr:glycosyltransferase family 39 protein [Marinilongibacter aquaticus]UBM59113.1 glycosyltransferase family 39 protein [Marinilongibacter aquaticus]
MIKEEKRLYIALLAIFIVYICFMFIDVMDADAAQYAFMGLEMLQNKSYLQVFLRGTDYLDKPPLIFWMGTLSYSLFGVSNFAYKLPAVLFLITAIYSTFKFGSLWYNKRAGLFAALILASSQAFFLMSNDVRTDGYLTGSVALAMWQISLYLKKGHWKNILFASFALALGMMSKGPITLIIAASAIGGHLLFKQQWKKIFDYKWLLMLLAILVFLLPMCYGLYTQFDLHPEKFVYGLDGPSGLRFFFWTQSFGRITGEIYWANDTSFFFFFHTILWDFQPWISIFVVALVLRVFYFVSGKKKSQELITLFGFVLPFIALSLSHYKLPHYIFVLLPFASIITADYLCSIQKTRFWTVFQFVLMHLYFALAGLCLFYFFPEKNLVILAIFILGFILFWWVFLKEKPGTLKLVLPSLIAAISLGAVMALSFYPNLLKYQSRGTAGRIIRQYPESEAHNLGVESYALDYYSRKFVSPVDTAMIDTYPDGTLIFTTKKGAEWLGQHAETQFETLHVFDDYKVSMLNINFLRPEKREGKVDKTVLLRKTEP